MHKRRHLLLTASGILLAFAAWLVLRPVPAHRAGRIAASRTEVANPVSPPQMFPVVGARCGKRPNAAGMVAFERNGWISVAPLAPAGRLLRAPWKLTRVKKGAVDLSWSFDGRLLAFTDAENVYVVEARAGAHPVTIGHGFDPAFSPRGNRLAYVDTRLDVVDVHVGDLDSGQERLLRIEATEPCWSGDGRRIVARDIGPGPLNGSPLILDSQTGRLIARLDKTGGHQYLRQFFRIAI